MRYLEIFIFRFLRNHKFVPNSVFWRTRRATELGWVQVQWDENILDISFEILNNSLTILCRFHSFEDWRHQQVFRELTMLQKLLCDFKNYLSNCEGLHAFLSGKWGGSRKWWSTDPLSTQGGFSLCQVSTKQHSKSKIVCVKQEFVFFSDSTHANAH